WTEASHVRLAAAIDTERTGRKITHELERTVVDTENAAAIARKIAGPQQPLDLPPALVARIESATTALRRRVFAASLAASARDQLGGRFERAVEPVDRALR